MSPLSRARSAVLVLAACHGRNQGEVCIFYEDFDGDGFGGALDCDADRVTAQGGDCDDGTGAVYPGADETWYDGRDSDCDGQSDYDADGDGYDAENCDGAAGGGRVEGEQSLGDASASWTGTQDYALSGYSLGGGEDLTGDGAPAA